MNPSIQEILAPLEPHWDRIIRRPMSSEEVDQLEKQVGLPMPAPLREYLLAIGLFQDLTSWNVSPIEVYDRASQFVSAREFLCEILPPKHHDLFPFGGDGAGNEFCLPTAAAAPCRIHFVDHETHKVSKRKEFADWLQSVVKKVLRGIRRRIPNQHKVWSVQFSFGAAPYDDVKRVLSAAGAFEEIDADWTNSDTTDEGVTSSERQIKLGGECWRLGRLEYAGWDGPLLSLDMRESLAQGLEHSQIRRLNALFKEEFPDYRLVDYGPLDGRRLN